MRLILALSLFAALIPSCGDSGGAAGGARFPAPPWPNEFEGRFLQALPVRPEEGRFAAEFPGQLARFTDGEREILMRRVFAPTRALHPSADCFRGIGYSVSPLPLRRASDGALWSCFDAVGKRKLVVCEQVRGSDGTSYSDVSAWYWQASMGNSGGPWLALTVVSAG